ncbi:DUF4238 domain-containing protein [Streptomyces hygroscopicus]|uniref:DUF4238 domain-containing protein n=1 Tax=Streptomyces hygroscopicus TaxID=1912 RepID=UPI002240AFCA|nr:DUF4238 domain-containing protein [Streptomyces hygroscopicus]
MPRGPLPPLPTPDVVQRRIDILRTKASVSVHAQHLVSGVMLRQFSSPIGQGGAARVYSLNLEYPNSNIRGRGLEECGQAPIVDFVKFESGSMETVWGRVENAAGGTFAAVRDGHGLDPIHLDRLRNLVAIHHARSIQHYALFQDNWLNAAEQARRFWQGYPAVLDAIATSQLGLPGGDSHSRERAFQDLHAPIAEWVETGILFRALLESRYRRTRYWMKGHGIEILTPSHGSEFVIGDIPALTVRKGMPNAGVNGGIGYAFADAIVLPISPKYALRVIDGPSRYVEIDEDEVREFNAWQVRAAFSHVYLRPGSGLEDYVRLVERPLPSTGVYRDFYQTCKAANQRDRRA